MDVISRKRIIEFNQKDSDSSEPLDRWYRIVKKSTFSSFADLRKTFPQADQVGRLTVFNVSGNKFRLIAFVVYVTKRIYIRHILTHSEYDKGSWKVEK